MLKVKIKLPGKEMGIVAHNLQTMYKFQKYPFLQEIGIARAFYEIGELFLDSIIKHREDLLGNPDKIVSKQIPVSHAILFFARYNGIGDVTEKSICLQIEEQLFKSGYIKLPEGVTHG